jgi:4-hydroxybenzoyl-CoA reductase subunit beta
MTTHLPPFGYLRPSTIEEAARTLAELGSSAVLLGGGTDLVPNLKRRQISPSTVVSLGAIESLREIRIDDDGTAIIGASTKLSELARSSELPPAIVTAASLVASPQIRNSATVGGNLCLDTRCNYIDMPELWRQASGPCMKEGGDVCWVAPKSNRCWAICSSDLVPVCIALEASVRLFSSRGERVLPVEELWRNESDGIEYLTKQPDEIITELIIPPASDHRATYQKLRRRGSIDFPILGVAAALRLDEADYCRDVRIVLGAIAPAPLRPTEAEQYLEGGPLTDERIEEASELAGKIVRPQDNADLGSRYRKWMASVHVRRALQELASREQP